MNEGVKRNEIDDDEENKRKTKKKKKKKTATMMMKNNHIYRIDQLVAYVFVIWMLLPVVK